MNKLRVTNGMGAEYAMLLVSEKTGLQTEQNERYSACRDCFFELGMEMRHKLLLEGQWILEQILDNHPNAIKVRPVGGSAFEDLVLVLATGQEIPLQVKHNNKETAGFRFEDFTRLPFPGTPAASKTYTETVKQIYEDFVLPIYKDLKEPRSLFPEERKRICDALTITLYEECLRIAPEFNKLLPEKFDHYLLIFGDSARIDGYNFGGTLPGLTKTIEPKRVPDIKLREGKIRKSNLTTFSYIDIMFGTGWGFEFRFHNKDKLIPRSPKARNRYPSVFGSSFSTEGVPPKFYRVEKSLAQIEKVYKNDHIL